MLLIFLRQPNLRILSNVIFRNPIWADFAICHLTIKLAERQKRAFDCPANEVSEVERIVSCIAKWRITSAFRYIIEQASPSRIAWLLLFVRPRSTAITNKPSSANATNVQIFVVPVTMMPNAFRKAGSSEIRMPTIYLVIQQLLALLTWISSHCCISIKFDWKPYNLREDQSRLNEFQQLNSTLKLLRYPDNNFLSVYTNKLF